jgi:hypothetical protein
MQRVFLAHKYKNHPKVKLFLHFFSKEVKQREIFLLYLKLGAQSFAQI